MKGSEVTCHSCLENQNFCGSTQAGKKKKKKKKFALAVCFPLDSHSRVVFLALFHHHLSKNQNQSTELESGFEG